MTKKIQIMEMLVDIMLDNLNEQFFSPSMSTARIKGEANVGWTDCFNRRCNTLNNDIERDICKEQCRRDAATEALARVRGLLGDCQHAKNPMSCTKAINDTARAWDNRIARIDDKINKLKIKRDKFLARTGRG